MKDPIYSLYKKLADSDTQTIRTLKEEFESILGMKVDDETFIALYIHARYLPAYNVFPRTKLMPLNVKSKFRLPKAANFLFKKFSRTIVPNEKHAGILSKLHQDGYYVVENFLKADEIDRIKNELSKFEYTAMGYGTKHNLQDLKKIDKIADPNFPSTFGMNFPGLEVSQNSQLGQKMIDPFIADIASSYFQTQAYLTDVSTMYTIARDPKSLTDKSAHVAAQAYHLDYSDLRFLTCFMYLSDVKLENGPHTFVAGSHEERLIYPTDPNDFQKAGFRTYTNGAMEGRVKDEWVKKTYGDKIKEFVCPKGTLIIENTSGFHKGGYCTSGHRETLTFTFAISNLAPPEGQIYIDYTPDYPFDNHLTPLLKSLRQDRIDKADAFKLKYTINQRIRGKIITTFNLKGLTVD